MAEYGQYKRKFSDEIAGKTLRRKVKGKRRLKTSEKADLALALARKNRGNLEEKYHDYSYSHYATYAGRLDVIGTIAQGTQVTHRIGNHVNLRRLLIRGRVQINSAASQPQTVRIVAFLDRDNTIISWDDVYDDAGSNLGVYAYKNTGSIFKTKTLLDKTFAVAPNGAERFILYENINLSGAHMTFPGSPTTAANHNSVKIFVIGEDASGGPDCIINTRLIFVD